MAAAAPLGTVCLVRYAKCHRGRTDITLAGSRCRDPPAIVSQAGLQARAGSPDPSRGARHVSVGLSPPRPSQAPPSERHGCVSCAIIWVCQVHNMGVPCTWRSVCSVRGTPKVCHNMGVPWHSPNRCTRMQDMRPNHRRAAHQSEPAGRAHAPLCLTPINSEAPPHHPIGTATK